MPPGALCHFCLLFLDALGEGAKKRKILQYPAKNFPVLMLRYFMLRQPYQTFDYNFGHQGATIALGSYKDNYGNMSSELRAKENCISGNIEEED